MAESVNDIVIRVKADTSPLKSFNAEIRKAKEEVARTSSEFGKGSQQFATASQKLKTLQTEFTGLKKTVSEAGNAVKLSKYQLLEFGENLTVVTAGIKTAVSGMSNMVGGFITEANKLQAANLGLESIATFKGINPQSAQTALQNLDLVKNGLLTVGDAALALKNLLATGFTLEESINLINGFGDAAAFGRQSSLEFGYAITSATEGLKNQNSILVDNAGVTKNLSVILKEAGFSAQDLQNVTSDLNVRQALYNGILKETKAQSGDAAKLTQTFAGQQAKLEAQITTLKQEFGVFLQNALMPYIEAITESDKSTKTLAGGVAILGSSFTTLLPAIAAAKYAFAGFSTTALASIAPIITAVGALGYALAKVESMTGFLSSDPTKLYSTFVEFTAGDTESITSDNLQSPQQRIDNAIKLNEEKKKSLETQKQIQNINKGNTGNKSGTTGIPDKIELSYQDQYIENLKKINELLKYSTSQRIDVRTLTLLEQMNLPGSNNSIARRREASDAPESRNIYEDVTNTYGAINNMMSVLNLGTETFVSKMLGGFNSVLIIMESIKAVNSILSFIPGFASGGSFSGGPMIVGERGPELLFANTSGYVMNNQDSMRYLNQNVNNSQPAINVYVGANLSPKYFTAQLEKANSRKNYIKV